MRAKGSLVVALVSVCCDVGVQAATGAQRPTEEAGSVGTIGPPNRPAEPRSPWSRLARRSTTSRARECTRWLVQSATEKVDLGQPPQNRNSPKYRLTTHAGPY